MDDVGGGDAAEAVRDGLETEWIDTHCVRSVRYISAGSPSKVNDRLVKELDQGRIDTVDCGISALGPDAGRVAL